MPKAAIRYAFCYLGERRLQVLEAELPPDVFILGVDGHTALVLDWLSLCVRARIG